MTPDEILQFFFSLVDDGPDEEMAYVLMDSAYTKRNEKRNWRMLLKLDTSITHNPSDTSATEKSLPTDFGRPYRLYGGNADNEYQPILFEEMLRYTGGANMYALDMANRKMRLLGAPSQALTMYLYYLYAPTSLIGLSTADKASTSIIVWPKRFQALIAYDMAEIFFGGVDADEITRQMAPQHRAQQKALEAAMIAWDNSITHRMMGGSSSPRRQGGDVDRPDTVNLDLS